MFIGSKRDDWMNNSYDSNGLGTFFCLFCLLLLLLLLLFFVVARSASGFPLMIYGWLLLATLRVLGY